MKRPRFAIVLNVAATSACSSSGVSSGIDHEPDVRSRHARVALVVLGAMYAPVGTRGHAGGGAGFERVPPARRAPVAVRRRTAAFSPRSFHRRPVRLLTLPPTSRVDDPRGRRAAACASFPSRIRERDWRAAFVCAFTDLLKYLRQKISGREGAPASASITRAARVPDGVVPPPNSPSLSYATGCAHTRPPRCILSCRPVTSLDPRRAPDSPSRPDQLDPGTHFAQPAKSGS